MVCAGQLVYGEQDIADVKRDVAAIVRVVFDVAHRAFPYAVEIQTDQVAVLVYHRTSGIASRGVVGGDEAYRNCLLSIVPGYRPLTVILGRIDVAQPLWNVIVENLRIVLFNYSFERRLRLVICPVGR